MRYFLEIAYKGTRYHGWQSQTNALGIQAVIEEKLSLILREPIHVIASGRTDAGVHASCQYAHFDTSTNLALYPHGHSLNQVLPDDIAIKGIYQVAQDAHARFDAVRRGYEYRLSPQRNPFLNDLVCVDNRPYHWLKMNQAAEILLNYTDFQTFSKVHTDVNHFRCQIYEAYWTVESEMCVFHISANRFLRGMVRAIVGTLLEVGLGKISLPEFARIIEAKDRRQARRSAPAEGLFLTQVAYPYPLVPILTETSK